MDTCDPLLFCNVRFRLNVVTVPIQWTKSSTGHEKQINKSLGTDPKMAGMLKVVYKIKSFKFAVYACLHNTFASQLT